MKYLFIFRITYNGELQNTDIERLEKANLDSNFTESQKKSIEENLMDRFSYKTSKEHKEEHLKVLNEMEYFIKCDFVK